MRMFLCALHQRGGVVSSAVRRRYEATPLGRHMPFEWLDVHGAAVLLGADSFDAQPMAGGTHDWAGVGMVRLDNRRELESWLGCRHRRVTDLQLAVEAVARHGHDAFARLWGDFAFVCWNVHTRTIIGGCDVFAIKKLYYLHDDDLIVFSSRAEALGMDAAFDVEYLTGLLAGGMPSPGLTPYASIRAVPAAATIVVERGQPAVRSYWSADAFEPGESDRRAPQESIDTCRELLIESVRLHVADVGGTWAHLSGGMDSSSVVSVAQWLAERGVVPAGLSGTVSYVDQQGTGADERQYSNAVVQRWPVSNKTVVEASLWYDDTIPPPALDLPRMGLVVYPRDVRTCDIVRHGGGRVLLTGLGGDELFSGTMLFFADWIASGRIGSALREMAHRAAIGRVSFWELAYRNALLPLLPSAVIDRLPGATSRLLLAPWIDVQAARRFGKQPRDVAAAAYGRRRGKAFHHMRVAGLEALASTADYQVLSDALDVRHPFLYRPLVEFALRLPPALSVQPHAHKWVLREAMRGILPDLVRERIGKGETGTLLAKSLVTHRTLLDGLLREPILAELGVIDATQVRAAFAALRSRPEREDMLQNALQLTLAVEAWLQLRSGRWPSGGHNRNSARIHVRQPLLESRGNTKEARI